MDLKKDDPVLVTTEHRGVFFGYYQKSFDGGKHVALRAARNCISWTRSVKGFLGLASLGPDGTCRIGPPADISQLRDVTSIARVTADAVAKWESAPWS